MKLERIQTVPTEKSSVPNKPGIMRGSVQVVSGDGLTVNDKAEDERPKHQYNGTLYNKNRVLEASKTEEKTGATLPETQVSDVVLDITV